MARGVATGRPEYGFRHSPDSAGRGGLRQVTEFGAQMAPVSAKAGGNWSGEGLGQRAGGGVPRAEPHERPDPDFVRRDPTMVGRSRPIPDLVHPNWYIVPCRPGVGTRIREVDRDSGASNTRLLHDIACRSSGSGSGALGRTTTHDLAPSLASLDAVLVCGRCCTARPSPPLVPPGAGTLHLPAAVSPFFRGA